MRKKFVFEWEFLAESGKEATYRAKVIGGWIVIHYSVGKNMSESMIFIPDRDHEWMIMPSDVKIAEE